jgi:hypothetical protein
MFEVHSFVDTKLLGVGVKVDPDIFTSVTTYSVHYHT